MLPVAQKSIAMVAGALSVTSGWVFSRFLQTLRFTLSPAGLTCAHIF